MDKIQKKMVELIETLPALEICMNMDKIGYPELILYLQYDIPLESDCKVLEKLKVSLCKKDYYDYRYSFDERKEVLEKILNGVEKYVISCEGNGNQAQVIYKEAVDVAKQICKRLNKPAAFMHFHPVHYYPEKAAM